MDGGNAGPAKCFSLDLLATDPKRLSDARQARWPDVVRNVDVESSRIGLCFVAELLELLDGEVPCRFTGGQHVSGFGAVSEVWTLAAGRFRLSRALETTFDSQSSRVRVDEDRFEDSSRGPGPRLRWNGQWRLVDGIGLEVTEVDESLAALIVGLAEDCCSTVRVKRDPPEPAPPTPPLPSVPKPLASPRKTASRWFGSIWTAGISPSPGPSPTLLREAMARSLLPRTAPTTRTVLRTAIAGRSTGSWR